MGDIVPFTDNFSDLSNLEGFQFEFNCERCGNGYRSPYQPNVKEKGKGVLRAAGGMFGGKLSSLSHAAETLSYDRGTNSKAKDDALRKAVDAVRDQFMQCRACGNWVCVDVCWNADIGQCATCSPFVVDEVSRAQAAAQVEQIRSKARDQDWTADLDLTTRAKVACPHCGASVEGGKFCPDCGGALAKKLFCTSCGAEQKEGAKFCSECGTKM
jgi:hypothetical protein